MIMSSFLSTSSTAYAIRPMIHAHAYALRGNPFASEQITAQDLAIPVSRTSPMEAGAMSAAPKAGLNSFSPTVTFPAGVRLRRPRRAFKAGKESRGGADAEGAGRVRRRCRVNPRRG